MISARHRILFGCLLLLSVVVSVAAEKTTETDYSQWGGANTPKQGDELWQRLSYSFFGERELIEGDEQNLIRIEVPLRAENDALVPVRIVTDSSSGLGGQIKHIYLTVDVNPIPLAAKFTVSPERNPEQIATRVRVNGYTYVRAIAELTDGRLLMDKKWVKSRGAGCSAPPGTDQEEAKRNLGKMRFRLSQSTHAGQQSQAVQLFISHPNNTGMQRDQLSTLFIPPSYVKEVEVKFNDELLLKAETSFTLSENPSFRFNFNAGESGELVATMTDTDERRFYYYQTINEGK